MKGVHITEFKGYINLHATTYQSSTNLVGERELISFIQHWSPELVCNLEVTFFSLFYIGIRAYLDCGEEVHHSIKNFNPKQVI